MDGQWLQKRKVLLLGASSWLGYEFANAYINRFSGAEIIGTYHNNKVEIADSITLVHASDSSSYFEIIENERPKVICNFLRGEEPKDFIIHQRLIELCELLDIHYVYFSSVLALDGYKDVELTESLSPNSISNYGNFKGQCEEALLDSSCSFCIIRFSSVQGWVPHKPTRNQIFLQKLRDNEKVIVDRGVLQNRLLSSDLIDITIELIEDRIKGIIHLGTIDSSDEIEFLKAVAHQFGYSPSLIKSGIQRQVNLNAQPGKILDLYGTRFRFSEERTLKGLLKIEGLKNLMNKDGLS